MIFCMDDSGSMAKHDAVSGSGAHSSRANVVLECCEQLVQAQVRTLGTQLATVEQSFSCIHFNDVATRTFEQLSCVQAAARLAAAPLLPHTTAR